MKIMWGRQEFVLADIIELFVRHAYVCSTGKQFASMTVNQQRRTVTYIYRSLLRIYKKTLCIIINTSGHWSSKAYLLPDLETIIEGLLCSIRELLCHSMFSNSSQKRYWMFDSIQTLTNIRHQSRQRFREKMRERAGVEFDSTVLLNEEEERLVCSVVEENALKFCQNFSPPLPWSTICTAFCLFKRFYLETSVSEFVVAKNVMMAIIYLACKLDDFYVTIETFTQKLKSGTQAENAEVILSLEMEVLTRIKCHLYVYHPFRPLEGHFISMKTLYPEFEKVELLRQGAYDFLWNSLFTDVSFLYSPSQIALAALLASAKQNMAEEAVEQYIRNAMQNCELKKPVPPSYHASIQLRIKQCAEYVNKFFPQGITRNADESDEEVNEVYVKVIKQNYKRSMRYGIDWKKPIVVILGATGTGKTELAVEVCLHAGGEIISADAMQMYAGLAIATNKSTVEERRNVNEHLVSSLHPLTFGYTVQHFRQQALQTIAAVQSRGRLPVLVGGTNYYIESLIWNTLLSDDQPSSDTGHCYYQDLPAGLLTMDGERLLDELRKVDPHMACRLHPNNRRRLLRSLQVWHGTGRRQSDLVEQQRICDVQQKLLFQNCLIVWLRIDRQLLHKRLQARLERMLERGLKDELIEFYDTFYDQYVAKRNSIANDNQAKGAFQCLGFKEFLPFLRLQPEARHSTNGLEIFQRCLEQLHLATCRYAKKQVKWIENRIVRRPGSVVLPVYALDIHTDTAHSFRHCIAQALSLVDWFLSPGTVPPVMEPLNHKTLDWEAHDDKLLYLRCETCNRYIAKNQWNAHALSKKHRHLSRKLYFLDCRYSNSNNSSAIFGFFLNEIPNNTQLMNQITDEGKRTMATAAVVASTRCSNNIIFEKQTLSVANAPMEQIVIDGAQMQHGSNSCAQNVDLATSDLAETNRSERELVLNIGDSEEVCSAKIEEPFSRLGMSAEDEAVSNKPSLGRLARQEPADSVDYGANDFKRSFDLINKAALKSAGFRIRRDHDANVYTQHRDPYSFYWHLSRDNAHLADDYNGDNDNDGSLNHLPARDNSVEEFYATDDVTHVKSPDSHDSGIQMEYAQPSKPIRRLPDYLIQPYENEQENDDDESPRRPLPPGWERHEDPRGFSYYWHVDSGTVQRERPTESMKTLNYESQSDTSESSEQSEQKTKQNRSTTPLEQPIIVERAFKQTTLKRRVERDSSSSERNTCEEADSRGPVRFAVRSLGWTEIAEENLTPEKSSRAVNRAIVDLSTGRNDFMDNVSKWGDGKELIMELDDHDLRLCDPDSDTVLHVQPIHQIRVWGVGRDNGRDFAYVARDRNSRRFMCHVFRCDTPARTIANTLRDICKRLMMEKRPNSLLPGRNENSHRRKPVVVDSFPTPMEEPKKVIRAHFLGVTQVPKATGVDVLNEAVDRLVAQVRSERWILVDVSIAPSTITVTEVGGNQIAECRVRYLSFLGIGRDIKHCAFIMHMSTENYMCYVFHVEPSAGAMAKTIEAACKLRYQKVIDAHGERRTASKVRWATFPGWSESIRDIFGNLSGHRRSANNSARQHYAA
ncbi:Amyloid beta A4 precursor protein-binding family B member 2 [Trichinella pseudospiralis]|uniref:Amyloid beta A4 protein-binding family B member 2 n=1 Tax=Trichinella pseudospiralis TaxID=6337 RepID=A0A0V1EM28_TRIPS|nr:Amyloid beta A4 precursor protein-binding family B member 2 [Trichinella pseudospiralis]